MIVVITVKSSDNIGCKLISFFPCFVTVGWKTGRASVHAASLAPVLVDVGGLVLLIDWLYCREGNNGL